MAQLDEFDPAGRQDRRALARRLPLGNSAERFTARKSFKPVVHDETAEDGAQARASRAGEQPDAHVSRVLADANADAFRRLEAFVVDHFDERVLRAANGGETPQHLAQRIPAGLVLAGGTRSDDHEETFASSPAPPPRGATPRCSDRAISRRGARGPGSAPTPTESSPAVARDVARRERRRRRRRGGGGGGGLGVAVRCIFNQLRAGTRGRFV